MSDNCTCPFVSESAFKMCIFVLSPLHMILNYLGHKFLGISEGYVNTS